MDADLYTWIDFSTAWTLLKWWINNYIVVYEYEYGFCCLCLMKSMYSYIV